MKRLTFLVRNGVIELISEQEVDMRPLVPHGSRDAGHAFWYELRDGKDKTLLVQPADDPVPQDMEVFSNDPSRNIHRAANVRKEHAFSVVLPTVPGADSVVLMRARPSAITSSTAKAGPPGADEAVEVARFKLSHN